MKISEEEFQQEIFKYIDSVKEFLSPEMWQNVIMDCSKNEIFILWLLYRYKDVNMTQIADYINVPLNTATGIISRMEKKNLVCRERSVEDKRIVTIQIAKSGDEQLQSMLKEFMYYGKKVVSVFSTEEMELFFRMMNKLRDILKEERTKDTKKPKIKKISIE